MQDIICVISDNRLKRGNIPIPQSTLYRIINSQIDTLTHGALQELHWLVLQGIEVSDAYNLANARVSLSDIFTYTNLKGLSCLQLRILCLKSATIDSKCCIFYFTRLALSLKKGTPWQKRASC
jgi:hypothetical protein